MNSSVTSLRTNSLTIFQAGINAADPYVAVNNCLNYTNEHLEIALDLKNKKKRSGNWAKIHIIAFGKAACKMAKAANDAIPNEYLASKPIAITNDDNAIALNDIEAISAGHPLPNKAGQKAAQQIINRLKNTQAGDLVLVLVSGGGSALIPYPAKGITLNDKIATTNLLLASGADIKQINCVRKHLSGIKGGHLARLAAPTDLHTLVLSDVLGDDLSSVASGPTVPDITTFAEAIAILKAKKVWDKVALNVQILLKKGAQGEIRETPKPDEIFFQNTSHTLVGSNSVSLNAMNRTAKAMGYKTEIFSRQLTGEAKDAAELFVQHAKILMKNGLTEPTAILSGGETTVTLKGTGRGGRNQEMALSFAIIAERQTLKNKWVFLSGGTDGRDGPTDAAGGIVDPETISRIKQKRANPKNRLNNNDSYSALKKSQDLLLTGATGTNVADLQVLLIHP